MKVIVADLLYLIGIGLVVLSVFLTCSASVNENMQNIDKISSTTGLKLYVLVGIIRLLTFFVGLFLIVQLTLKLIKEKREKTQLPQ